MSIAAHSALDNSPVEQEEATLLLSIDALLLAARVELDARAVPTSDMQAFFTDAQIAPEHLAHIGLHAVTRIREVGNGRFELGRRPMDRLGFVFEVYGDDGHTVVDLAAWLILEPERPLTMFGRAAVLGGHNAVDPRTYMMGKALLIAPDPREWLRGGGQGAAILDEDKAGRWLMDLPGDVATRTHAEARRLRQLLARPISPNRVRVLDAEEPWK